VSPRGESGRNEVLLFRDGRSTTIAAASDPAPDTGRTFTNFGGLGNSLSLNNAGEVTFRGLYDGMDGIFATTGGALRSVALEGNPIARTSERFGDFGDPRINNAGDVAFRATFDGAEGIFTTSGGALHPAVVSGDPVPGTTSAFDRFEDPVLNGAGNVAFFGEFDGSTGIFATRAGGIVPVARVGQPAPGLGEAFADFTSFNFDRINGSGPAFNRAGQVAFLAALSGGGVGLFVGDSRSGELVRIVSPGDLIEVAPGDLREVSALATSVFFTSFIGGSGNEDGGPSGLNEHGQVGFSVEFASNGNPDAGLPLTGAFIATPQPVSPD
jgi:hypothetical protein